MIDIHITDEGVKLHIKNVSVSNVLAALAEATIKICEVMISEDELLVNYSRLYGNKKKEV